VGETETQPELEIILELEGDAVTEKEITEDLDTRADRDETNDLLPTPELELEAEVLPEYVNLAVIEGDTEDVLDTWGDRLALDIELALVVDLELLDTIEEADKVRDCLEL
jgi:hypothetical protein